MRGEKLLISFKDCLKIETECDSVNQFDELYIFNIVVIIIVGNC